MLKVIMDRGKRLKKVLVIWKLKNKMLLHENR
jgi:hypothetical protein